MTLQQAAIHLPSPYVWACMKHDDKVKLTLLEVEYRVCKHFGIKPESIHVKTNKRDIVMVRQITCYLQELFVLNAGVSSIARFFNQDHTTVIHSRKTVNNLIDTDDEYNKTITELTRQLKHIAA